ncbi:hypothetical protein ACFXOD_33815 [Streptomyces sp. NPDC059161]|uniref:hypothetical protein n=1 Tax=Streptomyces sp. NPDC059161 TaxID=3346749 RepID=UPI00369CBE0C
MLVEPVAARRLRYAARAAGVGLVSVALFALATWLLLDSSACRSAQDYGCLGFAVLWAYTVPFLDFFFSWTALRIVKVRPAWLTALLGVGTGWYVAWSTRMTGWVSGGTLYVQLAVYVAVFALAAWFTQSTRPLWPRAVVALALVLLMPLGSVAAARSSQEDELAAARVALLGPNLPAGYHLNGVGTTGSAVGSDPTFYYRLTPDSLRNGANTMDELHQEIHVIVGPLQPGFAPPAHCVAVTNVYPVPSHPCSEAAPGVWRWSNYQYVEYFTRVGSTVAVVQADTPPVNDAVLREIAATMRVRTPSYFSRR